MRPTLLFIAHHLPYPPDSGPAIRALHTLRLLATRFDVHCLAFYRGGRHSPGDVTARAQTLGQICPIEIFGIGQTESRVRWVGDHAASVMRRQAYTKFVYHSRLFRTRLQDLLRRQSFDLIHVDSLADLCGYLPLLADRRVVATHHNVESRLLARRAEAEQDALRRRYLALQGEWIAKEERRWAPRVQLNVTVSENEAATLRELVPGASVMVVPNGVDVDEFQPMSADSDSIVYIGGMEWGPNRDALNFFCEEILPLIRRSGRRPSVTWIGRASTEQQEFYARVYGVTLTGYIDDIRPIVRAAACCIVPLRIGGGTRLKIVTAWAMGKPVVSTTVGCEGLAIEEGQNILVRDDPAAFAGAIVELLENDGKRRTMGKAARRTAETSYAWEVIGRTMLPAYESLIGRN